MKIPSVSIIIPCRNELAFIQTCIESIASNGFSNDDMEVIVIDGISTDGTRQLLAELAADYAFLKIIDNAAGATPVSLNLGIRAARGGEIVRIDAHSTIQPGYISKCVGALRSQGVDNVGGVMLTVPQTSSLFGTAVAACLSHVFGVGGSRFRTGVKHPTLVDTVFGGCFRRSVFDEVGYFNEKLVRGQDMEFNRRLKAHGGKILLLPDVVSVYRARSTLKAFLRHNWTNGVWAILPLLYSAVMPVSLRHLIPLVFALGLSLALGFWAAMPSIGWWAVAAICVPYAAVCIVSAIQIAWMKRNPLLVLVVPFVFLSLHIGYGFGSCWGCLRVLGTVVTRRFRALESNQAAPTSTVNS